MAEGEECKVLLIIHDLRKREGEKFHIEKDDFRAAVNRIHEAYNPKEMTPDSKRIHLDFDSPDIRYAYMVKYPIHAAALQYLLTRNKEDITNVLQDRNTINICCLGGGPGFDVIGFAAEFCESPILMEKQFEFTLIDNKIGWKTLFDGLFEIADGTRHGNLGKFLKSERVSHSFIGDDLSIPMEETLQAVSHANILSLMKFVSALDPKTASRILQNLYSRIRPGTLVVFLDNSGGGSKEIAKRAANKCGFEEIGWSTPHEVFERPGFDEEHWGVSGRNGISISMIIWKKPETLLPADAN